MKHPPLGGWWAGKSLQCEGYHLHALWGADVYLSILWGESPPSMS